MPLTRRALVQIKAVEGGHDVGVVGHVEVGHLGLAEALNLHIAAVVRADGHAGVDDVGDDFIMISRTRDGQLVGLLLQLLALARIRR